jgi:hypothetical protein
MTDELPFYCNACKQIRPNPASAENEMHLWCAECRAKCGNCGGTKKVWIHPRLGLWTPCPVCSPEKK